MDRLGNVVAMLIGVVSGLAIGLMVAPMSGRETRGSIARRFRQEVGSAVSAGGLLVEEVKSLPQRGVGHIVDAYGAARDEYAGQREWQRIVEDVEPLDREDVEPLDRAS